VISRRAFIGAIAGGLAAAPGVSAPQARKLPRIGYLTGGSIELETDWISSLKTGLRELGFVERENVVIELRHAAGQGERLSELAEGLIRSKVDVLVTAGDSATLAAKKVTRVVSIVFVTVSDPVGIGLVPSLGRPGGNITGLSDLHGDLVAKRLGIMKDLVPSAALIAVVVNPANPSHTIQLKNLQAAAPAAGVTLLPREVSKPEGFEGAFAVFKRERAAGLIILGDRLFLSSRTRIVELMIASRLPTMFTQRRWVEGGGLVSYGAIFNDVYRRAAFYVDKILKGAKPGDLPVEQPTRLELVLNLKTAKAIGLTVPPPLLARADEVIQ